VVGTETDQTFKVGINGLALNSAVSGQGTKDAFSNVAITSSFVRLLAQEGYVTIRAAPRVTAKDGEKANISINRETFFSLQPASTNVFFRQDVQKVEAGISLEITPRIHHDMVSVVIGKAEVSEDIRSSSTSNDNSANSFPIINRRQVSTEVMVRDGHTIVIGGLVQRQTVDRIAKVPFFSSIPLLGKLFQTIEKQEQDAEVAIFITPRIVPTDHLCNIQPDPYP
jgi:type II secretory pathway component GspD/PulD (secretin)